MRIALDYSHGIILPYAQGMEFMAAMENAESYKKEYQESMKIEPIDKFPKMTLMSQEEYIQIKMATLMGVKQEDIPL